MSLRLHPTSIASSEPLRVRVLRALRIRARRASGWSAKALEYGRYVRRQRAYRRWASQINRHRVEVFVGPNLDTFGGIRHHIHAIEKYSCQKVGLVPNDAVLQLLAFDGGTEDFVKWFKAARFPALRAVHSHVDPWFIYWCKKQQKSGVRWIHTYHLNYFPEHAKAELLPWQKEFNHALLNDARHADVRISTSRWQQDDLGRAHGIETLYLPTGVDVALCDQADANRFHKRIGDDPFVLYVGRNAPVKNPADFARLAACLPELQFVMIGQGLTPEVLRTEWQVDPLGNLLVYGSTSRDQVQDAIAACSALVVTSKREGQPTLVLEAMVHGRPIVVPDEAGCMETIGEGDFGFIYRQGDLDDLVRKTLLALGNNEKGKRARRRVLAEYDWHVIAPKLDAIYRGEAAISE